LAGDVGAEPGWGSASVVFEGEPENLRDVFSQERLASGLGDEEPIDRWRLVRERLPQYRVTDEGTLAEWVTAGTPSRHRLGPNRT
jgi:hypothetical protein